MPIPNGVQNLTEGVVSSFESGIGAVELLIEKGLEILDEYRREQEAIRENLRERLASVGNLRRKDFDDVIERILDFQSHRERDLKELIRTLLAQQKALAGRLKRCLQAGIFNEVNRYKQEIAQTIGEARTSILEFQREQDLIRKTFEGLEAQKGEISTREFKRVVHNLEKELTLKGGESNGTC